MGPGTAHLHRHVTKAAVDRADDPHGQAAPDQDRTLLDMHRGEGADARGVEMRPPGRNRSRVEPGCRHVIGQRPPGIRTPSLERRRGKSPERCRAAG